jgi:hypothetical protein
MAEVRHGVRQRKGNTVMGWQAVQAVEAQYVIVSGPGGGVFIYNGTPGPGNPPIYWETNSPTDPYGNTLPTPGIGSANITYAAINGGAIIFGDSITRPTNEAGSITSTSAGFLRIASPTESVTDTAAILGLLSKTANGGLGPSFEVFAALVATSGTPSNPTQISTDTWNTVTTPTGMTGTIRVMLSPLANLAMIDVNVVITSTNTTGTSYTGGTLPSASYYPSAARQFPLSVNQGMGTSPSMPRLSIPTSGDVALIMPGFTTAGNTCIVSGLVTYPLN